MLYTVLLKSDTNKDYYDCEGWERSAEEALFRAKSYYRNRASKRLMVADASLVALIRFDPSTSHSETVMDARDLLRYYAREENHGLD